MHGLRVAPVQDLSSVEPALRELVDSCDSATGFQTVAWWQASAEHEAKGSTRFLGVWSADRLVGFAPFAQRRKRGLRTWFLLGMDYRDAVADPHHKVQVAQAIFDHLAKRADPWDLVELRCLRPESVLLSPIADRLPEDPNEAAGAIPNVENLVRDDLSLNGIIMPHQVCPYLPLAKDWDGVLKGLEGKRRWQVRTDRKKLTDAFGEYRVRFSDASSLNADLDHLFRLHQARWTAKGEPGVVGSDEAVAFYRAVSNGLIHDGNLRLGLLELQGRVASAAYCIKQGGHFGYLFGGFDETLKEYRPGHALIGHAIEEAIACGCTEFDFLKGLEPYKSHWTRKKRQTWKVVLSSGGFRARWEVEMLRIGANIKARKHRRGSVQ